MTVSPRIETEFTLSSDRVSDAVASLAAGAPVVLVDRDRDLAELVLAADRAGVAEVTFAVRHGSGLIYAVLDGERADELELPPMVRRPDRPAAECLAVAVDAASGITTGISARDRAHTLRVLASPSAEPADLRRPGHVMVLRADHRGVVGTRGRAEAARDLCTLAESGAAAVTELVADDDGGRECVATAHEFAARHGLSIVAIDDVLAHRLAHEPQVVRVSTATIPTRHGEFTADVFVDRDGTEHLALVAGQPHLSDAAGPAPLVRIHSECLTGDVLGSLRCDCGTQLDDALATIAAAGCGVVVYVRGHEGRGIGLAAKLAAYALQESGRDTVEANVELGLPVDAREYWQAADILRDLGVSAFRLITNNPAKVTAVERLGLTVTERVVRPAQMNEHNAAYLVTKAEKMGHLLDRSPAQTSSAS